MQQPEIDSAVFCDGAHYTIISRENSSILTCPVTSGAGGYTLNRVEGRDIDREIDRLTGHAACIAVDVPTWCRIAGDPLDAVADALADLLTEAPTRFELERLAYARGPGRGRRGQTARRRGPRRLVRHAVAQHGRPLPRGAPRRRGARALPVAHRSRDAGARRQEGRGIDRAGRGRRARAGALGAALPVREHAFTRRVRVPIIGQYPHRRRLLRAGPPKEFRHGTHRPRI